MKKLLFAALAIICVGGTNLSFSQAQRDVEITSIAGYQLSIKGNHKDYHETDTLQFADLGFGDSLVEAKRNFKLNINRSYKQIIVSKEGYKDESYIFPENRKGWIKTSEIKITPELERIPVRPDTVKQISLAEIDISNLSPNTVTLREADYQLFVDHLYKHRGEINYTFDRSPYINYDFDSLVRNRLTDWGYFDGSEESAKKDFNQTIHASTEIEKVKLYRIQTVNGDFACARITTNWQLEDYFGKPIYSKHETAQSCYYPISEDNDGFAEAIEDAITSVLIKFLDDEDLEEHLYADTKMEDLESITIPKSDNYAPSIAEALKSTVTIKNDLGHGSGFFISSDGYILTAAHVIEDKENISIVTADNQKYTPEIIRVHTNEDVALLKIDIQGATPLNPACTEAEFGTTTYCVGTPESEELSQSISKGIISGFTKDYFGREVIQMNNSVNMGDSGGPLLDANGNLLGMVFSKLVGIDVEGISFSIPCERILGPLKLEIAE